MSMSHDEERVNGAQFLCEYDRAPRHGLNAFVGRGLRWGRTGIDQRTDYGMLLLGERQIQG